MKQYVAFSTVALVLVFALVACGGTSAAPTATNTQITLATNPNPPKSGDVEIIVQVKDSSGNPLNDATVMVFADHVDMKGMNLQGKAAAQGNGRYATIANFSMSGRWKVTVQANKTGMTALVQEFNIELK